MIEPPPLAPDLHLAPALALTAARPVSVTRIQWPIDLAIRAYLNKLFQSPGFSMVSQEARMPYSFGDFSKDLEKMSQTGFLAQDAVPYLSVLGYFVQRYGGERGPDYAYRFLTLRTFLYNNRELLARDGITPAPNLVTRFSPEFIAWFLGAYQEPTPPVRFGKHRAETFEGDMPYERVMRFYNSEHEPSVK